MEEGAGKGKVEEVGKDALVDGGAGKGNVEEVGKDDLGSKALPEGKDAEKDPLGSEEEKQGEVSNRKRGLGAKDLHQLEAKKKKKEGDPAAEMKNKEEEPAAKTKKKEEVFSGDSKEEDSFPIGDKTGEGCITAISDGTSWSSCDEAFEDLTPPHASSSGRD